MRDKLDAAKILEIVRRRRVMLIAPLAVTLLVSVFAACLLPGIYRSTGIIMIKYPQIPANLVPSTVTSYADQRLQAITEEVLARSKILDLVRKFDLLTERKDRISTEELVEQVRDRIILAPIDARIQERDEANPFRMTIAFKVSYEDENPKKAQLVTNELASYFVQKSLETREKHARNTTRFLENQMEGARKRLDGLETKLAAYRQAHLEELPDFNALDLQKIERITVAISDLDMQSRTLVEQQATIKDQLAGINPYSFADDKVMSPRQRLEQAKLQLTELLSKYSAHHPMVEAKKKEITLLESSTGGGDRLTRARGRLQGLENNLAALRARYTDQYPLVRKTRKEIDGVKKEIATFPTGGAGRTSTRISEATNPNYVTLKTRLDGIEASLEAIRTQKQLLEKKIDAVYVKLHKMPQVSKEYNEIETDYHDAKLHYTQLQQKSLAAKVGQGMEEEQLGETFELMDPPFLPEKPVRPNRLAIIVIGAILGLGLSVGGTCLREYTDDGLRDVKTLVELTGISAFSVIPRIVTDAERSRVKKRRMLIGSGSACGFLLALLFVNFFVMDLYVMYARVLRLLARYIPI
ncbi:MAG: hypothetical protein P4L55_01005 [Syntrophobacteraceae bacterium]|nr:hypothetical protein [Syntrophobacteraceae bacterium]